MIESLLLHAKKFGIDCVEMTASMFAMTAKAWVEFKLALAQVAREHRKNRQPVTWWDHAPTINGADILALHDEHLTPGEIAALTGKSIPVVRQAIERREASAQEAE